MLKLAFLGITGLACLFALRSFDALTPTQAQQPAPMLQCSPLELFNDCIQKRFLAADKAFGIYRVSPRTHIGNFKEFLGKFQPKGEDEQNAVSDLRKGKWQVGFYLAGRQVLGKKPDAEAWEISPHYYVPLPPIKGPLEITGDLSARDLPSAQSLWSQSQQAMKALAKQEQYTFTVGNWNFNARPIRAQAECLQCHVNNVFIKGLTSMQLDSQGKPIPTPLSTVKTGDVLGVALYAYRLSHQSNK